jgi:hypothetical protein
MGAERKWISRIGKGFLFRVARDDCKGILASEKNLMQVEPRTELDKELAGSGNKLHNQVESHKVQPTAFASAIR